MNDTLPLDSKPCLVTGGAGYLGRHLVDALRAKGCPVTVLDTTPSPGPREGVRWIRGDVRSRDDVARACENVDTVFHGSTEGLVLAILEDQSLSKDEAARIRAMIDRATGRQS